MYVCLCEGVTDHQIRRCVKETGVRNLRGLRRELGACGQCGKCGPEARAVIQDCLDVSKRSDSLLTAAA